MADEFTERQLEIIELLPATAETLADELGITESTIKDHIRHAKDNGADIEHTGEQYEPQGQQEVPVIESPIETGGKPDLPEGFIRALKKNGLTYTEMSHRYGWGKGKCKSILDNLSEAGYALDFETVDNQGKRRWYIPEERDKRYQIGDGDGTYHFAIISDTHLGSKATHLSDLHDFYDKMQERDVDLILHAGDISDGWEVHDNQINEVHGEAAGWDRLIDYTVENYPKREGITTAYISGNHDRKLWRRQGIRFGEQLNNKRDDLEWLGDAMARLVFDPENDIDIELIHPSGGQPYTIGYRAQTLYREQPHEIRPSLSAIGHLHGRMHAKAEGITAFYAGCWKDLTTYGKRKGHAAEIGGWEIKLTIENGQMSEIETIWHNYEADRENHDSHTLQDMTDLITEK